MLKAGPRERASTTFQARSRAVSPSAVSEEQVGVWGWASPLWRVSAPPAEMGFVRSEWTPTGSCFCPPSSLLQPGKPCSASVSAYIRTEQRLSPSLWSPFVSRRFIYGLKKLRVSVFVISVHTAEDGDDDGEGVQRAGGAFPDCHWRHEGNAKKTRLFHLILVVNICVTHIWCLRQGGCCRGFWSADPVAQNQRKAFRLCWRF